MNVLSLFDGMSCGRIALDRLGIPVTNYYAAEIDKYANIVMDANFPDAIPIGDVTKVDASSFNDDIDILMGGSPCQGFSFAGKQLNFNDSRSKLFFEFVRLLKECKPKYFLLDNVIMSEPIKNEISRILVVQPIRINSSLVSGQNRDRYYWTNIPSIKLPKDKGIVLNDVIKNDQSIFLCSLLRLS